MNMKKMLFTIFVVMPLCLSLACGGGNNGFPRQSPEFTIQTQFLAGGLAQADPNVGVTGFTADPAPLSQFTLSNTVDTVTDQRGARLVTNVVAPARWDFTKAPSPNCNRFEDSGLRYVPNNGTVRMTCGLGTITFAVNPSSIDVNAPPGAIDVTGTGIDSTYGMPQLGIYDEAGNLYAQTTAWAVSGDGTWTQAPTPYLGNILTGTYVLAVFNVNWDGSVTISGAAALDIYGNDPPPPPPPDDGGCGHGETQPICEIGT